MLLYHYLTVHMDTGKGLADGPHAGLKIYSQTKHLLQTRYLQQEQAYREELYSISANT